MRKIILLNMIVLAFIISSSASFAGEKIMLQKIGKLKHILLLHLHLLVNMQLL